MRILTRELRPIMCAVRAGTIKIAADRNRRDGYLRILLKLMLEQRISPVARCQLQAPAIIMNHDIDVVVVVERYGGAIVGRIVEIPIWRRELPNEFVEIMAIRVVTIAPAVGGKVILVP